MRLSQTTNTMRSTLATLGVLSKSKAGCLQKSAGSRGAFLGTLLKHGNLKTCSLSLPNIVRSLEKCCPTRLSPTRSGSRRMLTHAPSPLTLRRARSWLRFAPCQPVPTLKRARVPEEPAGTTSRRVDIVSSPVPRQACQVAGRCNCSTTFSLPPAYVTQRPVQLLDVGTWRRALHPPSSQLPSCPSKQKLQCLYGSSKVMSLPLLLTPEFMTHDDVPNRFVEVIYHVGCSKDWTSNLKHVMVAGGYARQHASLRCIQCQAKLRLTTTIWHFTVFLALNESTKMVHKLSSTCMWRSVWD